MPSVLRSYLRKTNAGMQVLMLWGEGLTFLASGVVVYVLISRLAGAVLLGEYSVVFAWLILFQAVGSFGLPEFITREIGRHADRQQQSKYVTHGLLIGVCASGVTMAVMAALAVLLPYDATVRSAILAGVFTVIPVMATALSRGGFLAHRRAEWVFLIRFLDFLVVIPASAYLIANGYGVKALVLAATGGRVASGAASLYMLHKYTIPLTWEFDRRFCQRLLPPIGTFGLSNALALVSGQLNVIMLSLWVSASVIGVYSAANKLIDVSAMLPVLVGQFMLPQLAASFADDSRADIRQHDSFFHAVVLLTTPLTIGAFFFASPLIHFLFGDGFADAAVVLRVLLIYFLFQSGDVLLSVILKASGRQKSDLHILSVNVAVNALMNVLLIPPFGALGAAVSKLASGLCSYGIRYGFISRRVVKLGWSGTALKALIVSALFAGGLAPLRGRIPEPALAVLYGVLVALCLSLVSGAWLQQVRAEVRAAVGRG